MRSLKYNKKCVFGSSSLPTAWLLGGNSGRSMDYLHAVWIGRNGKDCDDTYPECSDIYLASNNTSVIDPEDILASSMPLDQEYLPEIVGEGVADPETTTHQDNAEAENEV